MDQSAPEPTPAPAPTKVQRVALRWLLLALANALGPGLALWAWTRSDRKAVLLDNVLDAGESAWAALIWAGCSALVVGVSYAWVARRAHAQGQARGPALRRLSLILAPLAASIVIPLMHVPELERSRRLLIITMTVLFAGSLGVSVAAAWPWLRERRLLARLAASERVPPIALGALMVGFCVRMIDLGLVRHRALASRIWDLGIFDNLMWHAARGHWQTTSVLRGETFTSAHCAPILQLLAPIYAIAPGPETLIITQILWLASGAIPIYLLAVHVFEAWPARRWLGLVFGSSWLCHPSLHGVALFDFHALTLAAPMIPWAIYALETERRGLWIATIAALLLTREDLPFVVIALGLYALAAGRRRQAGLTIVAAIAGLAIVKLALMQHPDIFMPDADSSYRYANRFSKVIPDPKTGGVSDIVATVSTNPGFVIQHALTPPKLIYLAVLGLPTLALFVLGGRALWALSFGLVFTALGSGSNLHNTYLHYTVFLFPAMVAAAVIGLGRLVVWLDPGRRASVVGGVALALVCAGVLAGERFGALGQSKAFYAGNSQLIHELDDDARERYAWLSRELAAIPADASVSATITLGPHVSSRARFYYFKAEPESDWLVIRKAETSRKERRSLQRRVRTGELERVAVYLDELYIYRRLSPASD